MNLVYRKLIYLSNDRINVLISLHLSEPHMYACGSIFSDNIYTLFIQTLAEKIFCKTEISRHRHPKPDYVKAFRTA